MNFKFCAECGAKLILKQAGDDGLVPFCDKCSKYYFDIFPTCVIALVYNEFNEVAVLRQSYLSDKYATFVAGYIHPNENAENSILREIKEELGLDVISLEFVLSNWFSQKEILMLGYFAHVKKADFVLSSEVDSAHWITLAEVPNVIFPENPDNTAFALYKKFLELKLK